MTVAKPAKRTYCDFHVLLFSAQIEVINAITPSGAKRFTPKINQLSQSNPMGRPEQYPDSGHTNRASRAIEIDSSVHARYFSTQRTTQTAYPGMARIS